MTIKDLKEKGVIIIGYKDQSFNSMWTSQQQVTPDLPNPSPETIFIKNVGQRSIVAIRLIWEITDNKGATNKYTHSVIDAPSLMSNFGKPISDNKPLNRLLPIKPDEAQFFALTSQSGPVLTTETDTAQKLQSSINSRSSIGHSENVSHIMISLDCVIFDDGAAVGPNTTGYFEQVQTKLNARSELYSEILSMATHKNAENKISRYLNEITHGPRGVPGGRESTEATRYQFQKYNYARELLRMLEHGNLQICLNYINSSMNQQWVTLHKE